MRRAGAAIAAAAMVTAATVLAAEPKVQRVGYAPQLFVADRDGKVHRLTHGRHSHDSPVWSPDGRRIALFNDLDVEVVAARGGDVLQHVAGGPLGSSRPSWSPDGRRLAFARYHPDNDGHLVVVDAETGRRRDIAHRAGGRVEWSRDGRTIFYLHGPQAEPAHAQEPRGLYAIPARGGDRRRIAARVDDIGGVSPDGRWVAITRRTDGLRGPAQWIARTDRSVERLLGDELNVHEYGWAPGNRGVWIVQYPNRHGHPVVVSKHGRVRRLRAKVGIYAFAWSPDGRRLASSREPSLRPSYVLTSRPDGHDRRIVARFEARSFVELRELAWSPDSRRLAIVAYRHSGD